MKKIIPTIFVFCNLFLYKIGEVFAQGTIGGTSPSGMFENWFVSLLKIIIGFAGLAAAAVLIFNGYLYITSGGDDGKIQKAAKGITYAIVGLVFAAIAFLIVNFVVAQL